MFEAFSVGFGLGLGIGLAIAGMVALAWYLVEIAFRRDDD